MRFCYVDETGFDGESATAVMVGIVCDSQRLARAQHDLKEVFSDDQFVMLKELKGKHLYRGKKRWNGIDGPIRSEIIDKLIEWVVEKKHQLALAAIHYGTTAPIDGIDTWRTIALHIVLQLQRDGQTKKGGKGRAVVIFDENKQQIDHMAELLAEAPTWSDDYYERDLKDPQLDQIIDSAFTAKSHHVGLLQVADLYAYLFFRYEQLMRLGDRQEYWPGETVILEERIARLSGQLLAPRHRWAKRTESDCMRWYAENAPPSLLELGR